MALANPHTNILLDNSTGGRDNAGAAVTGTFVGDWYAYQHDDCTHNVVSVSILAGSGTVLVEGRVDALSTPTTLTSVTANEADLVARFKQMRVTLSGATALQSRVTVDHVGRKV